MAKRNLMNGAAVPMEPGERDKAVTIQRSVDATPASHVPKETWATLATMVWMRKMDAKSSERFLAGQVAAGFDTQWEMPYRTDMDPELVDVPKTRRLVYQGRVYLIVGADIIGRREGIEILTRASSKAVSA